MRSLHRYFDRPSLLRRSDRGFTLIGLLMVLVIISILVGYGYFGKDKDEEDMRANVYVKRADAAACNANAAAIQTDLATTMMREGEQLPSHLIIQASLKGRAMCTRDGTFYLAEGEGIVYCTEHNPPPDDIATIPLSPS